MKKTSGLALATGAGVSGGGPGVFLGGWLGGPFGKYAHSGFGPELGTNGTTGLAGIQSPELEAWFLAILLCVV